MDHKYHKGQREPSMTARENWYRYNEADSAGHRDFVKKAKQANAFYAGDQWDPADKKRLDREGRPALTLNMILSTVNAMIGEQLDRKVQVVYRAGDTGSEETAAALNIVSQHILDANEFDSIEETVFADGLIMGRGFFDVRLDFTKNIMGKVKITGEDSIDIIIDPEAKEADVSTWNEVFITRWMTVDQIGEEYGWKLSEKVEALIDGGGHHRDDNFDFFDQTFGGRGGQTVVDVHEGRKLRRVRVIERQHYEPSEQVFFVDPKTGHMRPIPYGADEPQYTQFALDNDLMVHTRKSRRVKITTSADDVLLHDDWSIYRSFTILSFFPYFRRGKPFGVVENLIDPQNLLNKTSSQELHIVNTTANSGWIVQENSLVDMDAEDLEERGAETGLVLQYKRGHEKPEKITANSIPTGIDRISQKAATTIREISAINSSMLGMARADMSGVAQKHSADRGQIQVSVVLNNLKRSRMCVAKKILELVQDFYSETRYFTITNHGGGMMEQGQQEQTGINVPQPDGSFLNDVTLGDYVTDITVRPGGGTLGEQEFEEAIRLRDMGIAIPDHVVVGYSNLIKRGEIVEFLKSSQGFSEPTEEEQQLQELQVIHQIDLLKRTIEDMDAKIELARATAAEKQARADSLDGFNQAAMDIRKLEQDKLLKQQELSLRIALAARGHQNASNMNDKRLSSSVALKAMDMTLQMNKPQPTSKATK